MKSATEYFWFSTDRPRDYINITGEVDGVVRQSSLDRQSGIQEGMVLVSAVHITAGVYVNDAEPGSRSSTGIIRDIDEWADRVAPQSRLDPQGPDYHHHGTGGRSSTGETNGDAHLKSLLIHHQVMVPITKGALDLGPWQQIYYAEFDGQRRKRVLVKAIGE